MGDLTLKRPVTSVALHFLLRQVWWEELIRGSCPATPGLSRLGDRHPFRAPGSTRGDPLRQVQGGVQAAHLSPWAPQVGVTALDGSVGSDSKGFSL